MSGTSKSRELPCDADVALFALVTVGPLGPSCWTRRASAATHRRSRPLHFVQPDLLVRRRRADLQAPRKRWWRFPTALSPDRDVPALRLPGRATIRRFISDTIIGLEDI
jgi:hypothetical protein